MIPNERGILPTVEILTGKEWTPVDIVKDTEASIDYAYTIDINTLINASEIKFSWTQNNVPKGFYDIYHTTMNDTITHLDKEALVKKYVEALSAKESEYSERIWKILQATITEALDIINFQATKDSIDGMVTKLNNSMTSTNVEYSTGDIGNILGISANDAVWIIKKVISGDDFKFPIEVKNESNNPAA